jgi:hypothetical protein
VKACAKTVTKTIAETIVEAIDVIDSRVVNIHSAEVAPPGVVPRTERFSPTERAPSVAAAETEADTNAPARTPEP